MTSFRYVDMVDANVKLAKKIAKKRKEERVHQFLMGVDGNLYRTVRSNLLAIEPLPSLNRVYLALVQEELVKIKTRGKDDHCEFMALVAHADLKPKGRGKIRAMKYLTISDHGILRLVG